MGGTYRAQVAIASDTALPADVITNTWHFVGTDPEHDQEDDAFNIHHHLEDFYNSIDSDILSSLAGPTAVVKVYNLEDTKPRIPVLVDDITITAGTGNPLPTEVAMTLSLQGEVQSGDVRARRRGRIFLGPLRDPVLTVVNGRHEFTSGARTTVADAMSGMHANVMADALEVVVFSPTIAGGEPWTPTELAAATTPLSGIWIDNAPDTIRSRGTQATARTTVNW